MLESQAHDLSVSLIDRLAVVLFRLTTADVEFAARKMELAWPLQAKGGLVRSLWLGPNHWFLTSDTMTTAVIIECCQEDLGDRDFLAIDYTSAVSVLSIEGPNSRNVLAAGSGLDFRERGFRGGACHRTQLAGIGATIHALGGDRFDVYIDRSYEGYFVRWLDESARSF